MAANNVLKSLVLGNSLNINQRDRIPAEKNSTNDDTDESESDNNNDVFVELPNIQQRMEKLNRQRSTTSSSTQSGDSQQEVVPPSMTNRATRFLSISESLHLPEESLLKLRQLHQAKVNEKPWEITDEFLETMPFRLALDDKEDVDGSKQESLPHIVRSGLTNDRKLEIIQNILDKLSKQNIVDECRRSCAIPYTLPRKNQLQRHVAERMIDLTNSDTVMLLDHLCMKNLCTKLEQEHQDRIQSKFDRLEEAERRRERHVQLLDEFDIKKHTEQKARSLEMPV
ncbi:unnamed protein product [Didymodactylos carnosus]|uniref:Uncharacterized protein n=1 Tax=Didymodactylos carnosus TaxID=1234261 RepID=A0A813V6W5_9BILA|nr:unnamed protein product [Didymodactylos carnosus]CAF0839084.1 unnamed protein product [Didymodactylos carnosus]CAF3535108.1 unnamed protein product [Didymodactylos carnosus]CAF3626371.1 unnamed protein product [Didymodactylos carnosus]